MSATKENENTLDKTRSSQPVSTLPPIIAIHGVGNHEPGNISGTLRKTFESASLSAEIDDFNWDSIVDHSIRNVDDAYSLLGTTAESISQAAAQPLKPSRRKIDILLFQLGEGLYQGLMRVVVALGLATLIIGPLLQLLVLLPSALFGMISWQDFEWVTLAATVVIAACVIVIAGLLVLTILRSLVTLSLRPLWVSVRRLSLLFLQPVFLLLTIPVSIRFGSGIVMLLGTIVPMMFISVVLAIVTSPLTGSFEETISDIGLSLTMLIGVAAIAGLHILLRKLWVGALLKVILDITRYVGSSTYRTKLQNALDDKIRDTRKRDSSQKIILYSHSLGSVIALDSLINSGVWGADDEVCLVTLGSPISRFFIRFFPGYLFPASIENAAAIAARRLRRFTWINIHRRWDYVGTGLGLDKSNLGVELCTGQISKVFSSHSNYWGDELVVEKLKAGLNKAFPVPRSDGVDFDYEIPAPLENSIQRRLAQIVQPIVAVGLVELRYDRYRLLDDGGNKCDQRGILQFLPVEKGMDRLHRPGNRTITATGHRDTRTGNLSKNPGRQR